MSARLLVVGNAAWDRAYTVAALPVEGASVLGEAIPRDAGGKGLNQAVMAARAGAPVVFATALGDDPAGHELRVVLEREGLDLRFALTVAGGTDESIAIVDRRGANCIVTTNGAARAITAPDLERAVGAMAPGDWLLVQGNLDMAATRTAIAAARRRRLRVALNPSPLHPTHRTLVDAVDLVVANDQEAQALDLPRGGATVVTRGAAGAELIHAGGRSHIPAPAVEAVDTVGAGDVLSGVMLGRLAAGDEPEAALRLAVRAAALKVRRRGTLRAFPTADELRALRP